MFFATCMFLACFCLFFLCVFIKTLVITADDVVNGFLLLINLKVLHMLWMFPCASLSKA